jgi:primary-amine oxidase
VLWHTFGVTHIPAPEDFPVMPVEPITLLLRPRNFFSNNPVMDVPPSYASTPSQVAAKGQGVLNAMDSSSRLAFGNGCCSNESNGSDEKRMHGAS